MLTTAAALRVINHLNKTRMNKEAIENAAEALRQSLKDKQSEMDLLEGELANNALELNYTKDREERSQIHDRILADEEKMGDLQSDLQGLMDQLHSISSL